MKISILGVWFAMSVFAGSAFAEVVTCSAGEGAMDSEKNTQITIQLQRSVAQPLGLKYLVATTKNDDLHINNVNNTVALVRKSAGIVYRDILDPRAFQLQLNSGSPSGEGIEASLLLDGGTVFETKIGHLSCAITGTPVVPLAPCETNQAALDVALIRAAKIGPIMQVEDKLECGANPNARDRRGCSAIEYVADLECGYVAPLPGNNSPANPNSPQSPNFSSRSSLELDGLLRTLADHGADLNAADPVTRQTPLMRLVQYGQLQGVDVLMDFKVAVDVQDKRGNTALMFAAARGDEMMMRTLVISATPNLALKNVDGKTAYDLAVENGYEELADIIKPQLVATAKVEGKADGSCSPTMVHIFRGKPVDITLSGESKMFLLTAPDLGLELMSMPGEPDHKTITPAKTGTFPFTCGVHGAPDNQQTHGSFMVM